MGIEELRPKARQKAKTPAGCWRYGQNIALPSGYHSMNYGFVKTISAIKNAGRVGGGRVKTQRGAPDGTDCGARPFDLPG